MIVEGARLLLVMSLMVVLTLGAWVVVPLLWGWDAYTVTSGSMTPLVRPGDVVVASGNTGKHTIRVGAVVVIAPLRPGGQPITHRVVEQLPDGRYRTKGDANRQADTRLIGADQVIGAARVVVPLAGLVQLHFGRAAPIAGLLVILLSLLLPLRGRLPAKPALSAAVACVLVASAGAAGTSWVSSRAAWTGSTTAAQTWGTSLTYYNAVLATGPVSYWRMGGTVSSVPDVKGVASLTVTGTAATLRTGALRGDTDKSTHFTHTSSSSTTVATVNNAAHRFSTPFSVGAWTNGLGGAFYRVMFKGSSAAGDINYLVAWGDTGTFMRFLVDTAAGTRLTAGKIGKSDWPKDGAWRFVVGVWDGSVARLYINGVEADTVAAATVGGSNNPLTISEGSGSGMDGDVDEVAVWDKALSAADILDLYKIGKR